MNYIDLSTKQIEYKDINDMVSGCNAAMINYALSENGKIVRIITFFNTAESDLESISASHNYYCKSECKFIASKNVMFKIKSFNNILKYGIEFWAMLWKKVEGFTPARHTHDCTTGNREYL